MAFVALGRVADELRRAYFAARGTGHVAVGTVPAGGAMMGPPGGPLDLGMGHMGPMDVGHMGMGPMGVSPMDALHVQVGGGARWRGQGQGEKQGQGRAGVRRGPGRGRAGHTVGGCWFKRAGKWVMDDGVVKGMVGACAGLGARGRGCGGSLVALRYGVDCKGLVVADIHCNGPGHRRGWRVVVGRSTPLLRPGAKHFRVPETILLTFYHLVVPFLQAAVVQQQAAAAVMEAVAAAVVLNAAAGGGPDPAGGPMGHHGGPVGGPGGPMGLGDGGLGVAGLIPEFRDPRDAAMAVTVTYRLVVPENRAGRFIGKGGEVRGGRVRG